MNPSESRELLQTWENGIASGQIIPVLGPDSQAGCVDAQTGKGLPAQDQDLILAMTEGRPLSPKLMREFSRAAMSLEFKKGRKFIERFLNDLYENYGWSVSPEMQWISKLKPQYVVDLNRDSVLLDVYADGPHVVVQGISRLSREHPRYRAFHYDGDCYAPIPDGEDLPPIAPIVFKPYGCARPAPSYIVSDADYVDYITELMGGFAIPPSIKSNRKGKQYLIAGVRFKKDTERMVLRDIMYDADPQCSGWLIADDATPKERRFAEQLGLTVIDTPLTTFWP